jgi:hypothetical protein
MTFTLNNGSFTLSASAQSIKMGGGGHVLITANGTSPVDQLQALYLVEATRAFAGSARTRLPMVAE